MIVPLFWILNSLHLKVFEGTSGIDNKYTTVQFTGEVITYPAVSSFYPNMFYLFTYLLLILLSFSLVTMSDIKHLLIFERGFVDSSQPYYFVSVHMPPFYAAGFENSCLT